MNENLRAECLQLITTLRDDALPEALDTLKEIKDFYEMVADYEPPLPPSTKKYRLVPIEDEDG